MQIKKEGIKNLNKLNILRMQSKEIIIPHHT